MISDNNPEYVADLRFALDVMEESSHLGLDSAYASKLRSLIREQIAKSEKRPVEMVSAEPPAELISA